MKVALVHDYLTQYGGAEKVLEALASIFPYAPIYTLVHNPSAFPEGFLDGREIITSPLQKFPFARSHHRLYPLLMPFFVEQFDLSKFDIVISDTTGFAKGVITRPNTLHVCYCHTPLRYAWDNSHEYIKNSLYPGFVKPFIPRFVSYLRRWDYLAAQRPQHYIANSEFVAKRIQKYYHQKSRVIYPPVDIDQFTAQPNGAKGDYYLIVSRLLPYKRIDLAIEAFNKLDKQLKIVGYGPELRRLKRIAGKNIEFTGPVFGEELTAITARCKAFIFPQEEDLGIAPIEVMASGRPVIAYGKGGILETATEGVSGYFFQKQTTQDLIDAVKRFESQHIDPVAVRESVEKFSRERFVQEADEYIKYLWEEFQHELSRVYQNN